MFAADKQPLSIHQIPGRRRTRRGATIQNIQCAVAQEHFGSVSQKDQIPIDLVEVYDSIGIFTKVPDSRGGYGSDKGMTLKQAVFNRLQRLQQIGGFRRAFTRNAGTATPEEDETNQCLQPPETPFFHNI